LNAAELSAILSRQGVPVIGHREGDEHFGGLIRVTDTVHVELAIQGGGAVVVKVALNEKEFEFYKLRTKVKELIFDLIKAGAVVLH
jgi:hypothetical protein